MYLLQQLYNNTIKGQIKQRPRKVPTCRVTGDRFLCVSAEEDVVSARGCWELWPRVCEERESRLKALLWSTGTPEIHRPEWPTGGNTALCKHNLLLMVWQQAGRIISSTSLNIWMDLVDLQLQKKETRREGDPQGHSLECLEKKGQGIIKWMSDIEITPY